MLFLKKLFQHKAFLIYPPLLHKQRQCTWTIEDEYFEYILRWWLSWLYGPASEGYSLIYYLEEVNNSHKIIIYDKLDIEANSSHSFIGHVIQSFRIFDLEAVFCVKDLLIFIYMENGLWIIKEFKITKFYRLKEIRQYPLYNYIIQKGGRHTQN